MNIQVAEKETQWGIHSRLNECDMEKGMNYEISSTAKPIYRTGIPIIRQIILLQPKGTSQNQPMAHIFTRKWKKF